MSLIVKDGNGNNQTLRTQEVSGEQVSVQRPEAVVAYSNFTASLVNGGSFESDYIDMSQVSKYQIIFKGDATGLQLTTGSYDNPSQTPVTTTGTPFTDSTLFQGTFPSRQLFMKFGLQNNTGSAITNVSLSIKLFYGSSDGASVFPLSTAPLGFSTAVLTQSVLTAKDNDNVYQNVAINNGRALLTANFGVDVALGKVDNYALNVKFGRNNSISTGTTPEDVWNGGSVYTGHNCTTAQTLDIESSSVNDVGAVVSSGSADDSTGLQLTDLAATFISDGVAVNDIVINDTQQFHGYVASVDSETQLTVYEWYDNDALTAFEFSSGDNYRIAEAASTGAAVIKLNGLLDGFVADTEYVVLNGTTAVTTTKEFIRQDRGRILKTGSANYNVGEITAHQTTTTANITMVMPADSGQTAVCCSTVPVNKVWVITAINCAMARANGAAGSANVQFQVRQRGGAWQTKRFGTITSSLKFDEEESYIIIDEQTDIKWRVQTVSDNNTIVTARFKYFEIDK